MAEPFSSFWFGADKPGATHFEAVRLASFEPWPADSKVFSTRLAKEGFYYAGSGEGARCYACHVQRDAWTTDDDPRAVHAASCPMVAADDQIPGNHIYNVPLPEQRDHEVKYSIQVQDLTNSTDIQIPLGKFGVNIRPQGQPQNSTADRHVVNPLYPLYRPEDRRSKTFWAFPNHLQPLVQGLSQSGFFFTHFDDAVICYCCGVGVKGWRPEDNPHLIHARFSPDCQLVPAGLASFAQRDVNAVGN